MKNLILRYTLSDGRVYSHSLKIHPNDQEFISEFKKEMISLAWLTIWFDLEKRGLAEFEEIDE